MKEFKEFILLTTTPLKDCFVFFILFVIAFTAPPVQASFIDGTPAAGLTSLGGSRGAAFSDYDGDGWVDLFVSGTSNVLYHNNGDGTFTDVTASSGITVAVTGSGVAWGDYDGDRDLDLYIASEDGPNLLYQNNGDGTFTDVSSQAGVNDNRGSAGVSWGDYDNDRDLDLFVANRFGSGSRTDRLYRNNGDGTFTDVGPDLGVGAALTFMGVWFDYDNNGTLDLYCTVDFGDDVLYSNNGDGTFTDVSADVQLTDPQHGMGIAIGDPDGLGNCLNVISTNNGQVKSPPDPTHDSSILYGNNCSQFTNMSDKAGIVDRGVVEWGVNFIDYDNDMDEDLSLVAGGMLSNGEPNVLYDNDGSGQFTDVTSISGTTHTGAAFGSAWADVDNDGDSDWFVANEVGSNVLFVNNGPVGNYLKVILRGEISNTYGIGGRMKVKAGGKTQVRLIKAGESYLSGQEPAAFFGLGSETVVDSITVFWPSGIVSEIFNQSVNQVLVISEEQAASFAYITNSGDNTVSVIDTASKSVVATVTVDNGPEGVAIHPDGTRVYIANNGKDGDGNTVSVIDTITNTVIDTIVVGDGPEGIVMHPDGKTLYVATAGIHMLPPDGINDAVAVVDTATNTVKATVGVGDHPWALEIHPDGSALYVANAHSETISVIDTATNTVTDNIVLGDGGGVGVDHHTGTVVIHPNGSTLYVAHFHSDQISVVDTTTRTVVNTISVDDQCSPSLNNCHPYGMAVHPDGSKLYVAFQFSDRVSVIDTSTLIVIDFISVGDSPKGLAVTPDGSALYVANRNSNTVSVIDTATSTVTETIVVGALPVAYGKFISSPVDVDVDVVGGSVTGLILDQASCRNMATGQKVTSTSVGNEWNCEDMGLTVNPGDMTDINILLNGVAVQGQVVGGSVVGFTTDVVICRNLTTGQKVTNTSKEGSWNCEDMGLTINPGDMIRIFIRGTTPAESQIQFTEVSSAAGVANEFYNGATNHSLGINWIDYDNDGWPDLFLVNGFNQNPHLYHNNGDGTFTKVDELLPVLPNYEMGGSRFTDYDNDGDSDIFIYTDNEIFFLEAQNPPDGPPNLLLKNLWVENGGQINIGQPLFEEVAAAAGVQDLADPPLGAYPGYRAKTAGWLDYDRDGCVDLYVGHKVLQAGGDTANRDRLYRNKCDGTFEDVTTASGVNPGTDPQTYRPALAFIGADLNNDFLPDMYVCNVHEPSPYHHDFIFKNNGDGTFMDITGLSPGVGDDSGSCMGVDIADIDLNGTWDVYLSDVFNSTNDADPKGNVLYLGNGDGTFTDNSAPEAGVDADFSWAVNFFDMDLDGYEDLFVGTTQSNPFLYKNNGDGTFTDVAADAGINIPSPKIRGAATADYDRDGDLDLAAVQDGGQLLLFRNDTVTTGHWLQLELLSVQSNRDAIGAEILVNIGGGIIMRRQVKGGSSAHSQDSLIVHFGLGGTNILKKIRVIWPSGIIDTLEDVTVDTFLTIVEGSSQATP